MIKFKYLSLRNFLGWGNTQTIIYLDQPGLTSIIGENLDDTRNGKTSNGCGKAQPLHSKIKTPTGWMTMGEAKVGDIVSTPDGGTANIIGVYPQNELDIYSIRFVDGRTVECCGNHLWKVYSYWSNVKSFKILNTVQMIDHLNKYPVTSKNAHKYLYVPLINNLNSVEQDVELPIDPYLLGSLIGDGCLGSGSVGFSNADSFILEKLSKIIYRDYGDAMHLKHSRNYDYTIGRYKNVRHTKNNILVDSIRSLDLNCKSQFKFIPDIYKNASFNQKIELIRGLLDTDGEVSIGGGICLNTTSEKLANDFQELIQSIGGIAKISKGGGSYKNKNGDKIDTLICYRISVRYSQPKQLVSIPRKQSRISDTYQYTNLKLRIDTISHIGKDKAQCIMIDDPNHLYITDNYVVTHNTSIINGVTYALYDDTISKVDSKDSLINNVNKKNMEVIIGFSTFTGTYIVKRIRKGKGGNNIHLFEAKSVELPDDILKSAVEKLHDQYDDQSNLLAELGFIDITPAGVAATNELIETIIGIPYDMFIYIITISYSSDSFFDLKLRSTSSEVGQVEIIEKLFNLTKLTEKAESLKLQMKVTDEELSRAKQKYELLEGERVRHEQQLESAKHRISAWNENQDVEIARLEEIVNNAITFDYDKESTKITKYSELSNTISNIKFELKKAVSNVEHTDRKRIEWDANNSKTIIATRNKLNVINSIDVDAEYAAHEEIAELNIKVSEINTEVLKVNQKISDVNKEILSSKRTISDAEQLITKANKELDHLVDNKCPYCSQPFVDTKSKIEDNKKIVNNNTDLIIEENGVLAELNKVLNKYTVVILPELTNELSELKLQISSISKDLKSSNIKELLEVSKEIEMLTERLKSLENETNPYNDSIDGLNKIVNELEDEILNISEEFKLASKDLMFTDIQQLNKLQREQDISRTNLKNAKVQINPHLEALEELENIKLDPVDMNDINQLVKYQEHQKFLHKLLTKRDSFIRKSLLNSKIPYLNARFAYHANELGLKHTVEFTTELTASISQFGNEIGYGNLSHGQQVRVNLALSFAFRDVLQNMKNYINVCLLDEALDDGLDTTGIQSAFRTLKKQSEENRIALFVITHRDEVETMFDKQLTIQYKNGFSVLKDPM